MRAGAKGIEQSTDLVPMGFDGTTLTLLHHPTGADVVRTPDWVVLAVPAAPDEQLYLDLKAAGAAPSSGSATAWPRGGPTPPSSRASAPAPASHERRSDRPTGGRAPSSTRCTSARSPTATVTASATSRACASGSATSPRSASTPSGCARPTRRRSGTTATTSPTTSTSTPPTATSTIFDRLVADARGARAAGHARHGPQPLQRPAPVVPGRPAQRAGERRAGPLLVPRRPRRSAQQLGGGVRRLGVDRRRRRRPAVVPGHVHAAPARLRPPPPGRRRHVRRRPALLVRPRRRGVPGRRRVAGRQGPGPARLPAAGAGRVQPGPPVPGRGPRRVAALAHRPRRLQRQPTPTAT